jgi:transposase
MLDETIITETPPLYDAYGRVGQQIQVPISGNRAKRILHGAMNITTGAVCLFISHEWDAETHQAFLRQLRAQWRGWRVVLFEDRGTPHTAHATRSLTRALRLAVRFLPRATPELNAMDQLWRRVKAEALANQPHRPIEQSAELACQHILAMSPHERLRKAGVLSGKFWLTT